jgi:hypothetical protein
MIGYMDLVPWVQCYLYPGTCGYKSGYSPIVPKRANQQYPGTTGYTPL